MTKPSGLPLVSIVLDVLGEELKYLIFSKTAAQEIAFARVHFSAKHKHHSSKSLECTSIASFHKLTPLPRLSSTAVLIGIASFTVSPKVLLELALR